MKKIVLTLVLVFMMIACINVSAEYIYYDNQYHYYTAGEIGLFVNGKEITNLPMNPLIINNSTMVPVREVFEALGSEVIWHNDTRRIEIKNKSTSLLIGIGDRNVSVNGKTVMIDSSLPLPMLIGEDPYGLKSMVPVRFVAERLGYNVEWDGSSRVVKISEKNGSIAEIPEAEGAFGRVTVSHDSNYDYIYIAASYGISPKIIRFTDPERIAFDFSGAKFLSGAGNIKADGNCIESVRYSNHDDYARLVLDMVDNGQTMIMSSDKGILIRVESSVNKQIVYDAFSGRVYFDKAYAGIGKRIDNGYSVTFTNLKLENQKIAINDNNVKEITISNSSQGCTVSVTGNGNFTYTAEKGFYKDGNKPIEPMPDTNVSGSKLVVIDAGHGGSDPGAVGYNSSGSIVAYESKINLAIAKLLGKKLESSGIKVVYTRSDDTYISLKERSELSNEVECDMFVSIHCNSMENSSVYGTQVYYHPVSEVGTVLAENIYDNMVADTGLAPKGTQNGAHLYVIRTTTSPAVLVETAFISNEKDRNYLLSANGQETIANAIYKGIMQTIEK